MYTGPASTTAVATATVNGASGASGGVGGGTCPARRRPPADTTATAIATYTNRIRNRLLKDIRGV